MTKYTAQFSNGDRVTRNSDREYSHAWRVINGDGQVAGQGFAGSRDLAEKAARQIGPRDFSAREKKMARMVKHHSDLAKRQGFKTVRDMYASRTAEVAQWRANAKIEIVEAERG